MNHRLGQISRKVIIALYNQMLLKWIKDSPPTSPEPRGSRQVMSGDQTIREHLSLVVTDAHSRQRLHRS